MIRVAKDLGIEVFMYLDDPGVYYSQNGKPIPRTMAALAGYDVEALDRQKRAKEAMAKAATSIAAQLQLSEKSDHANVIAERDGYTVVSLGGGQHVVKDPDGVVLTQNVHLSREIALKVLDDIAPPTPPAAPPVISAGPGVDGRRVGTGGTSPLRT
jgi:hypothetical protein